MNKYRQSIFLVGLLAISLPCMYAMQIENGYVIITDYRTQKLQVPEELRKLNLLLLHARRGDFWLHGSMLYVDPQTFIDYLSALEVSENVIQGIIRCGLTVPHVRDLYAQMRQSLDQEKYNFVDRVLKSCGFTRAGNQVSFIHPDYTQMRKNRSYYFPNAAGLFKDELIKLGFKSEDILAFMQEGKTALKRILQNPAIKNNLTAVSREGFAEFIEEENWPQIISAAPAAAYIPAAPYIRFEDQLNTPGFENLEQSLCIGDHQERWGNGRIITLYPAKKFLEEDLGNLNISQELIEKIKKDGLNNTYVQQLYAELDRNSTFNSYYYKNVCKILKDCGYINKAEWSPELLAFLGDKGIRPDEFESLIRYVAPLNGGRSNIVLVDDADALDIAAMKKGTIAYVLQELTRIKNKIAPHLASNNLEHKDAAKKITDFANALQVAQPQLINTTGWNAGLVNTLQKEGIAPEDFEKMANIQGRPGVRGLFKELKRDGFNDKTYARLAGMKQDCESSLASADANQKKEAKEVAELCAKLLKSRPRSFNQKMLIGAGIGIAAVAGVIALVVTVRKGIAYAKEYINKKNKKSVKIKTNKDATPKVITTT